MWIASGRCDVMAAGGSEAAVTPTSLAGFTNMTAMSSRSVSEPFSATRDGFVIAEGAAVLLLEAWGVAEARGATILAEILGGASTADAHHITAPDPEGVGVGLAISSALRDAGVTAAEVGHINAHGTSTPLNDAAESRVIRRMFGDDAPPVTSTKGVTGHSLGAAGAIEAAFGVLTLEHGLIPPTANLQKQDPEVDLDVVHGEPREAAVDVVMSNSFGFGGQNGVVVLAGA